jgi:hypothetical protein
MSVTYIGSLTTAELFPQVYQLIQDIGTLRGAIDALRAAWAAFIIAFEALLTALASALDVLSTLEGGIDFILNASFGLIPLKAMAMLEFQGALRAVAGLTIAISNPLSQAVAAITAMSAAIASLQASLALGLPTVSAELGMQLSAIAAVSAAAAAKMAGIQAVIDAVGSLTLPLTSVRVTIASIIQDMGTLMSNMTAVMGDVFNLFDVVLNLSAAFSLHLAGGANVSAFAVDCLAASFAAEVSAYFAAHPVGGTVSSRIRTVIVVVDYTISPGTWMDVSYLMRTAP